MDIKSLTLENFLTFEELQLSIEGVKAIQGLNLDDDDQESNGSGKSTIQEGILFAILGTTTRGISVKELVKWGAKKGYVALDIFCPIRKETLLIERTVGKSPKLDLTINSFPVDFSNINDGNEQIIKWLGISKEDLVNYYIINKDKYISFYTSSNRHKLDMIGRFSNLSVLDGSDAVVKVEMGKIDDKITDANLNISNIEGQITSSQRMIDEEKERDLKLDYTIACEEIDVEIEEIDKAIKKAESSTKDNAATLKGFEDIISEAEIGLKTLKEKKAKFSKADYSKEKRDLDDLSSLLTKKLDKLNADVAELKEEEKNTLIEKGEAELNIGGEIVCPKCSHEFHKNPDVDIKEEQIFLTHINNAIPLLQADIKKVKEKITQEDKNIAAVALDKKTLSKKEDDEIAKERKIGDEIWEIENKINKTKRSITTFKNNAEDTLHSIKLKRSEIKTLKKNKASLSIGEIDTNYISKRESEIEEYEKAIDSTKERIVELKEELFQVSQWKYNFKMFKSEMSMSVLNVITSYTNKIMQDLGSDIQIKWEGFKVKADGKDSDKITPTVIRNGESHNFGSFSGGERGRLEYASILANQYLINSTHKYGGLNFLATDEITEGIDALGLNSILTALRKTNKTIYITTHIENRDGDKNVLLVTKQNGKSFITKK